MEKKTIDLSATNPDDLDFSLSKGYTFESEQKRVKKRIATLFIACVVLALTSIIFIVLFSYSQSRVAATYLEKYKIAMKNVKELTEYCISTDYDFDTKYREIVGELGSARQAAFLSDMPDGKVNTVNKLYFASIKLPIPFRERLSDIKTAIDFILEGNDEQGYSLLDKIIADFDKQDY